MGPNLATDFQLNHLDYDWLYKPIIVRSVVHLCFGGVTVSFFLATSPGLTWPIYGGRSRMPAISTNYA